MDGRMDVHVVELTFLVLFSALIHDLKMMIKMTKVLELEFDSQLIPKSTFGNWGVDLCSLDTQ